MRRLLVVLFVLPVMGREKQAPAPAPEPTPPPQTVVRRDPPGPAPRVCAVPLKNVLRAGPETAKIRRFTPPPREVFPMREAPAPAPSCEDRAR